MKKMKDMKKNDCGSVTEPIGASQLGRSS